MASDNINRAAGLETAKIFQPRIDIEPQFDENGEVERQNIVIKDNSDRVLQVLNGPEKRLTKILENFGVTPLAIPTDLRDKVNTSSVDLKVIDFWRSTLSTAL